MNTTPLDNIELTVKQVCEATGVPDGAVTRMCEESRVPCRSISKSRDRNYWRIRTGDLQQVRDAYTAMQQETRELRQSRIGAQSGVASRRALLEARVDRLERELGLPPLVDPAEVNA